VQKVNKIHTNKIIFQSRLSDESLFILPFGTNHLDALPIFLQILDTCLSEYQMCSLICPYLNILSTPFAVCINSNEKVQNSFTFWTLHKIIHSVEAFEYEAFKILNT
jgi:hypothetical protein